MAAKAKETGNIDFTMLYRLFFVIWFNADSGNLTFSENALCFQGFLSPLLFLLSQIWDKKGDKKGHHLRKHDFLITFTAFLGRLFPLNSSKLC